VLVLSEQIVFDFELLAAGKVEDPKITYWLDVRRFRKFAKLIHEIADVSHTLLFVPWCG
jgi:hypothetical protein